MLSIDLENHSSSPDPSPCTSFHFLHPSLPNSISPSVAPSSEVDLPNVRPNFSIRDYVFTARRKDVEKNWPFSLKSLHLCFKHGVKDVLPPFQTLGTLRHQSLGICNDEYQSIGKHHNTSLEERSSPVTDHGTSGLSNDECSKKKLSVDLSSCRDRSANDHPPATTSISLSGIESSVSHKVQPRSGTLKCSTVSKVLAEGKVADPRLTNKTQGASRRLGRKCNLIVKFSGQSGRNSAEDIASNCSSVLDSMASKVCPVCKAFSSSSNTTLNAHIDQCLSAQPTPTWTAGSKLTRHRIKPRKWRLMTDIYSTAQWCTLEDLDNRNGTNWAASTCLPHQVSDESRTALEGKKQHAQAKPNDTGADVGSVYIDANGTKVRILSKLNGSLPVAVVAGNETRSRTLKGSKFSKKKIKIYQKSLKFSSQSKKHMHHKAVVSQLLSGKKIRKDSKEEQQRAMTVQNDDCATFKQWTHSKRRGVLKKIRCHGPGRSITCKWHLLQDFLFKSDQLFRGIAQKKNGSVVENGHMNSMLRSANFNRSEKNTSDNLAVESSHSSSGNNEPSSKEFVGFQEKPNYISEKLFESSDAIRTKAKNFYSFRKSILADDNSSFIADSRGKGNKSSVCKTQQYSVVTEDEQAPSISRNSEVPAFVKDHRERECGGILASLGKRKFQQKCDAMDSTCLTEQIFDLRSSKSANCRVVKERSKIKRNGMERKSDCAESNEGNCGEKPRFHPSSPEIVDRNESNVVEYADSEFYLPGHSTKVQASAFQSLKSYRGLATESEGPNISVDPVFNSENHMYACDKSANDITETNANLPVDINCGVFLENSFTVVDPIPIPGPPGSYLPSPRDMGSEDFQGHSSLTTSRIQSSVDFPDAIDGDSSDSHISVASTISNSVEIRSDTVTTVNPCRSHTNLELSSSVPGVELLMHNCNMGTNLCPENPPFVGEFVKISKSTENGFVSYRSHQPCCCQRQDSFTSYQGSQSSRGRKKCPLTVCTFGQQRDSNISARNSKSSSQSEFVSAATPLHEELAVPGMNVPIGSSTIIDSPNAGRTVVASIDRDSGSSGANPVLRLMGKNLMVVKKDEESASIPPHIHPPERTSNCSPQNVHFRRQLSTVRPISPVGPPHQTSFDLHYAASRNPILYHHSHTEDHYVEGGQLKGSGMFYNLNQPHEAAHFPSVLPRELHRDYAFETSLDSYEGKTGSCFPVGQHRIKNWQTTSSSVGETEIKRPDTRIPKEIIFVDQECDYAGVHNAVQMHEGWREAHAVSSALPRPAPLSFNPSRVYPITCHPPVIHHVHGESTSTSIQHSSMMPIGLPDLAGVRWGCTSDGSGVMSEKKHVGSSSSSSSSYTHVKSPFYYHSGFA